MSAVRPLDPGSPRPSRTRRRAVAVAAGAAILVIAALLVAPAMLRPEGDPGSRLAVHDGEGMIAIVDPGTGERVEVAGPAEGGHRHVQPTWSADGRRLAWADAGPESSTLHVVRADGSGTRTVGVPVAPFFLSWSPAGDRLAGLGSTPAGIGLFVTDLDGLAEPAVVDEGSPYYLDWAPDGEGLVIHVGSDVLADLDPAGGAGVPLEGVAPGGFRAPQWHPGGCMPSGGRFATSWWWPAPAGSGPWWPTTPVRSPSSLRGAGSPTRRAVTTPGRRWRWPSARSRRRPAC